MNLKSSLFILFVLTFLPKSLVAAPLPNAEDIDERSFYLGGITSWAEVVSLGIKRMALGSAMNAEVMDGLVEDARDIIKRAGVEIYREPEFLVTDLFPLAATKGKQVLIVYQGTTLDEYLALKKRKADLLNSDAYTGEKRKEIAWAFGKLLSYPDEKIEELIDRNAGK